MFNSDELKSQLERHQKEEKDLQAALDILKLHGSMGPIVAEVRNVLAQYDDDSVSMHTPIAYFRSFDRLRDLIQDQPKEMEVGCSTKDGLLNIHPKSQTCEMCSIPMMEFSRNYEALWEHTKNGGQAVIKFFEKGKEHTELIGWPTGIVPKENLTWEFFLQNCESTSTQFALIP
jgi:hypothetical protein